MTETQFKTFLSSFNDVTKELLEKNTPLYSVCEYIALMLWVFQIAETENSLILRRFLRSYYETGSFVFTEESPMSNGGTYL